MARPPKNPQNRLTFDLRIRLTEGMKRLVQDAADADEMEVSTWVRKVIINAARAVVEPGGIEVFPKPVPMSEGGGRSHVFPSSTPVPRGWVGTQEIVSYTRLGWDKVRHLAETGTFERIVIGRRSWYNPTQVAGVFRELFSKEPPGELATNKRRNAQRVTYADWNPYPDT
jgi:hypothetical protein